MGRVQQKALLIIGSSLIGLVMATIEYYLYTNNIILDAMISSDITIQSVMVLTVFIWELVGVVLSAI